LFLRIATPAVGRGYHVTAPSGQKPHWTVVQNVIFSNYVSFNAKDSVLLVNWSGLGGILGLLDETPHWSRPRRLSRVAHGMVVVAGRDRGRAGEMLRLVAKSKNNENN
jgi:hypothetical protein